MPGSKSDLPQGTLDLLILQIVGLGAIHGYAIAQRLQQVSGNVVQVPQGSLYPALHRLENRRLVTADWKETETGREVARLLADAEDELLAYMRFPREHWPKIPSTNPLERVNLEIARPQTWSASTPTTPPCCASPPACSSSKTTSGSSRNATSHSAQSLS